MQLDIEGDMKAAEKALGALRKQVPFAAWLAQKNTAFAVRKTEINHMKTVFKKTSSYTLRAPLVEYQNYTQYRNSTQKKMAVDLISQFKGRAGNRKRSRHYLWDHIHGQRTHTGWERRLIEAGLMPENMFAVRTKYLNLFSNGRKVSKTIYHRILSQLKAYPTGQGSDINATNSYKSKRKRLQRQYYVMKLGGVYGIWMRDNKVTGRSNRIPLFIFVKSTNYSKRFKFYEVAQRAAEVHWRREFPKALRKAIRTAK